MKVELISHFTAPLFLFWMSLHLLDPSCHDGQLIPSDQGCLRRAIAGAPQLSSSEILCQQNFFLGNLMARLNFNKIHDLFVNRHIRFTKPNKCPTTLKLNMSSFHTGL